MPILDHGDDSARDVGMADLERHEAVEKGLEVGGGQGMATARRR
jgi:hypothetical protein